jgi:hypothetical protein
MRESENNGSLNVFNTPVKKYQVLNNQTGKIDLPVKDLQCTEIYRMIYRKAKRK